ncbi:MAG: DinB family protein [Actinomycetota bacterium]
MTSPTIADLLVEYDRALAYTAELHHGLTTEQLHWREGPEASGIGWHLGHQPAVAHFMVRNLTAAEPELDPELDALMDSATPERDRGELPEPQRLFDYRDAVADRVRFQVGRIERGEVGAPTQLRLVAHTLLVAVVNHEYQHDKWVGEVRNEVHGLDLPPLPESPWLQTIDGYTVLVPA